jgi:hypothetical protein
MFIFKHGTQFFSEHLELSWQSTLEIELDICIQFLQSLDEELDDPHFLQLYEEELDEAHFLFLL